MLRYTCEKFLKITIVHAWCLMEHFVASSIVCSSLHNYMQSLPMLYQSKWKKKIQIGFLGAYLICIKWRFVPVFNGDPCTAVHIFSSLILASVLKEWLWLYLIFHIDFNTKHDQFPCVISQGVFRSPLGFLSNINWIFKDFLWTVDTEVMQNWLQKICSNWK